MAEYIKREAALEESVELYHWCGYEDRYGDFVPVDAIQRIPAADVAPIRHGRWIEQQKYTFGIMYDCSICDNRILDNGHSWNYCPNCGARMDGGDDDG